MSNQNICNICGANYEYIGGRWKCPACGAYKAEELSNEEVTLLYNAAQKLRLCDFNEAEIEYSDIIEKFPNNPEGYWGRLLARYGIKYEEDFDGRRIPTCYAASIKSVFGDPDYEKAMSLFPEADRAYYKSQAEYIDRVRKEWIEKASKEQPYDIFLCYKDSDLANGIDRTPDSIAVQDLYIHLTEQGYRVFYSRESLRDKVGEKYEPYIFNALSTAKVMLVYGSKPEYITSTWLKNEWTRYIKRIQAGEKLQNSLLVACDGFSPDLLPSSLSSRQCFDATKRSFYSDLDKVIKKALTPDETQNNTKREEQNPDKKAKKKIGKKIILISLALLVCFAVLGIFFGTKSEEPKVSQGLSYTANGQKCTITGIGTCTDTAIVVPKKIDGLTVTSIGQSAFVECTSLKSIEIPDSVTSIGSYAFFECTSLKSIEIPDSVTRIGSFAFGYCSSLTSIEIPDSVTSIGSSAFYGCSSLKDVYYTGSEEEWEEISIGSNNNILTNATIHYN